MDDLRWFVYLTDGSQVPDDVGAHHLDIINGDLVFRNSRGIISFSYARGRWRFVEFQDDSE